MEDESRPSETETRCQKMVPGIPQEHVFSFKMKKLKSCIFRQPLSFDNLNRKRYFLLYLFSPKLCFYGADQGIGLLLCLRLRCRGLQIACLGVFIGFCS